MDLLGMKYTTELKVQALVPLRKLTDPEFLKRKFVYDPCSNEYIAPLRLEVILDMPNWTRSGGMRNVIAATNLSTAHMELSLHDAHTFEKYHAKFIQLKEFYLPEINLAHSIYTKLLATRKLLRSSEAHF
jgi:hypothetical protein